MRSKAAVRSDSLEPHLRYLINRLNLPRDDLRQLLADKGAQMRFFCYWDNESGDRVPDVPDDIRTMMEAMGARLRLMNIDRASSNAQADPRESAFLCELARPTASV
ncbi:hypothetical protein [Paraburkholderia sp. JPY419]|uniref:hypothetical protein n=1 Tax=Paraburkholderia sp. JPY419 TaxID=667660 RepID=UPI003D1EB45A